MAPDNLNAERVSTGRPLHDRSILTDQGRPGRHRRARPTRPVMTPLTPCGSFAVGAMVVFYVLGLRSPWFVLTFAGARLAASVWITGERLASRLDGHRQLG